MLAMDAPVLLSTTDWLVPTIALSIAGLAAIATAVYAWLTYYAKKNGDRQTQIAEGAAKLSNIQTVYTLMEQTREDRHAVRAYIRHCKTEGRDIDGAALPEDVAKATDAVCRAYDVLGLLDRNDLLNQAFTDEFYSVPLVLMYDEVLGAYVRNLQLPEIRGETHFWELTEFYSRVRCVPQHHPAVTGRPWPDDRRMCL